ncbi:MAG TPA: cobalamin-dependent protein [Ktedonobacteraceae bacterium]|nr:cobalamin-dependent protein [Ktedonobacteraceae bacterium]
MTGQLQTLKADLFLLHAPGVYDFRDRDDILFAYLSDSDSVNVTSIYEMYPLGFFAIKQRLREHGFQADIVNLASLMLMHPRLNVDALLGRLEAPVFGFDLHWMAHCHGSIELAKRVKAIHPESLVIFGGISSTYYADQLIQYPAVDIVAKGYDTLEPVTMLMEAVRRGERSFSHIPNLVYKKVGEIEDTGFSHKPMKNYNDVNMDWGYYRDQKKVPGGSKLIMTLPNTGCAYDCPFCGGSRYATNKIMGIKKTLVNKDNQRVIDELRTLGDAAKTTSIYALQCYSETKHRLHQYLDAVKEMGYKSVFFETYHLPAQDTLEKMGQATEAYIMLSPQSHDPVISKLSGRGTYTMPEMEEWISRALDAGIAGIMIWFFIGMPQQPPSSVFDSISYGATLLRKFRGKRVLPLICPMVPFLDPGSRFFEEPHKYGYRIFHKTLEQHRQAMVDPLWHRRLNYETEWMSRRQIQDVTYASIERLVNVKAEYGILPTAVANAVLKTIDETRFLLTEMEHALELDGRFPVDLRGAIRVYNRKILAYSTDQIFPMQRPFGGRWYDDFTVPASIIQELTASPQLT